MGAVLLFTLNLEEAAPPAEAAPSDLAASMDAGHTTVTLTWTDTLTDNTGYAIERADGAGAFVEIVADAGDVETADDVDTFDPAIVYRYRLRVLGGDHDGEYSNVASVGATIIPLAVRASTRAVAPRDVRRPTRVRIPRPRRPRER